MLDHQNWVDIRRQDGSPYVVKEGEHIIKVGCHDENTGRHGEHVREYKGFEVSDSILDTNPYLLERGMKDHLRNKNALLSARHVNKTTRDTELFAANLGIYEAYVNKAIELAQKKDLGVNMEYERELTKRLQTNSETRKAELQTEVQKMQIQLEMLRLEKTSNPVLEHLQTPQSASSPQISTTKAAERDNRAAEPSQYMSQIESKAKQEADNEFDEGSPSEFHANSRTGLEDHDSFVYFVDLAIRKNRDREVLT